MKKPRSDFMIQIYESSSIYIINNKLYLMSEEKEKIQKYIIKSTPYGELTQVLKDLDKISPVDLNSPILSQALQQYNEEHLAIIKTQFGQYTIMSNNKVGEGKYLDQLNKKIFTVDHFKLQAIQSEDSDLQMMEEVMFLQKHLLEEANQYAKKYYRTPNGTQVFMEISESGLVVHLGLTSKNLQNLANFYTGEWISKWRITKESIEGLVSIKAHFFEGGNVQFNQKRQLNQEFQFTADMKENAKNIIKVIQRFEGQVQTSLNETYEQMPQKFFKKLRRIAPFTKTKMAWNINAIKMNHHLLKK